MRRRIRTREAPRYAGPVIQPTPALPWTTAFVYALPHGVAVGYHLPEGPDPVDPEILARLTGAERTHAEALRGYRQVQFVGGRLALAVAFGELGTRRAPVLTDEHGAPILPEGLVGSITHKQDLAVALVARGRVGVGVDLEETTRPRPGVAERVLTPRELEAVRTLVPSRQWVDTVVRFSVKESVYKAIHPTLQRYVGFGEVEVWPGTDGVDRIEALVPDVAAFTFEARHAWIGERILSTVRAEPK